MYSINTFSSFMILLLVPTYRDPTLLTSLFLKLQYMTYNNNNHILSGHCRPGKYLSEPLKGKYSRIPLLPISVYTDNLSCQQNADFDQHNNVFTQKAYIPRHLCSQGQSHSIVLVDEMIMSICECIYYVLHTYTNKQGRKEQNLFFFLLFP